MSELEGRCAIVTGGARGIGRGIADRLASEGAQILIADVNSAAAERAAAELTAAYGHAATGTRCDIGVRDQVEACLALADARYGGVDILVNNAGICPFVDVMQMEPEVFQRTIDINLTGAFHFTQLAGRRMISRGKGGRVVFITSLAVNVTGAAQVDYGASKAGLHMLMKGFAIALGPHGITCNAVAPGMILTDMTRSHWEQPGPAAEIKVRVPVGRIGTPADIGEAVLFLASPRAAYVNGTSLIVDGGHQAVCA